MHITENTGDMVAQACKSGGLEIPEGPFLLNADDMENRVFFFGVTHEEWNGMKKAAVKFHVKSWACQVNPALETVTFPNEAPRGVSLRSTGTATPKTEPPPEASGPVAGQPSTPPAPPVADAAKLAANPPKASIEELGTLSPEEFKEALEYAKKLREGKN